MTEKGLTHRFGLGKTPVREALGRLAHEGLVKAVPRQGYLVTPINVKDVQNIFALRLLLEPEAASLAAEKISEGQLIRLHEICNASYDPNDLVTAEAFLRLNTEFHATIAQVSGNERLAEIIAQLLCEMERIFHVGLRLRNRSEEMTHEHETLVTALRAGDSEAAKRESATQIEASREMVIHGLQSNEAMMTVNLVSVF